MTSYRSISWLDFYKAQGLDQSQIITISIVQRIMGTISIIGSVFVIQDVLRNEQKRNHTYHRLMVGLSIADVMYSFFAYVLSTTPMPKGSHIFAVGSVATCDIVGFINMMCAFTTILYNCSLSTYYLVQLKYNWNNSRIKALEKRLHIIPWSVGLVIAIVGLAIKLYGPFGFSCM
jgi:hypothetical protein